MDTIDRAGSALIVVIAFLGAIIFGSMVDESMVEVTEEVEFGPDTSFYWLKRQTLALEAIVQCPTPSCEQIKLMCGDDDGNQ